MLKSSLNKLNVLNLVVSCVAIACLTSLMHCHRDQPKPKTELEKLPAATQTGAYTFGCLVNGKAWVTRTTIDASAINQLGMLQIGAEIQTSSVNQTMFVFIKDSIVSVKSYSFDDKARQYSLFSDYTDLNNPCEFYADGINGDGRLSVTKFDQTKLIVSGTFSFTAWTARCDTIKVTEGRFDLHYIP